MSASVQLGLLLALATAFTSIVGFLYKHRGAVEAPDVEWRRPVRSSLVLFRSRWYTIGILVATASWGLHVAALALAPISIVQSIIAGGLVLLTVVADRLFGFKVTRREWICVALVAAGLAFLAATLDGAGSEAHSDYEVGRLVAYVGLGGALGLAATALGGRSGPALGVAAGLLWGASDVSIKALSDHLDRGIGVLAHPLALVILTLSLLGLLVSARSLQIGPAVAVIAVILEPQPPYRPSCSGREPHVELHGHAADTVTTARRCGLEVSSPPGSRTAAPPTDAPTALSRAAAPAVAARPPPRRDE